MVLPPGHCVANAYPSTGTGIAQAQEEMGGMPPHPLSSSVLSKGQRRRMAGVCVDKDCID
eukprot:2526885-Rhodomonas_salina.4